MTLKAFEVVALRRKESLNCLVLKHRKVVCETQKSKKY